MSTAINFPSTWTRIVSATIHSVGSCTLAFVLARRTAYENLDTLRGWRELGSAKLSVILAFSDSLIFLLVTGVLAHGGGLELTPASCRVAFFSCVLLYASSKVFIYNFLSQSPCILLALWRALGSTIRSAHLFFLASDISHLPTGSPHMLLPSTALIGSTLLPRAHFPRNSSKTTLSSNLTKLGNSGARLGSLVQRMGHIDSSTSVSMALPALLAMHRQRVLVRRGGHPRPLSRLHEKRR